MFACFLVAGPSLRLTALRVLPLCRLAQLSPVVSHALAVSGVTSRVLPRPPGRARAPGRAPARAARGVPRRTPGWARLPGGKGGAGVTEVAAWEAIVVGVEQAASGSGGLGRLSELGGVGWVGWVGWGVGHRRGAPWFGTGHCRRHRRHRRRGRTSAVLPRTGAFRQPLRQVQYGNPPSAPPRPQPPPAPPQPQPPRPPQPQPLP